MNPLRRLAAVCRRNSASEVVSQAPRHASFVVKRRAADAAHWFGRHATAEERRGRRLDLENRLGRADEVLFLCHGNICRSPFAERYARRTLAGRDCESLRFRSAGLTELSDPRSPTDARETAATYGVSLDDHLASAVTSDDMTSADVVVLMDYQNLEAVAERHPDAFERTFLLRILEDGRRMQIPDPYGRGPAAFENAYGTIADCVDAMLDEVASTEDVTALDRDQEPGAAGS